MLAGWKGRAQALYSIDLPCGLDSAWNGLMDPDNSASGNGRANGTEVPGCMQLGADGSTLNRRSGPHPLERIAIQAV